MKNIVVLYTGDDWDTMVLSDMTRRAFEEWHEKGLQEGVAFFRSSIDWYDDARGVFKKGWAYREKEWHRIDKPIVPTGVYDKTVGTSNLALTERKLGMLRFFPVINHPFFGLFLDNKFSQALLFKDIMPQTALVHSIAELEEKAKQFSGEKIVLKPLSGSGGNGVRILSKNALGSERLEFPLLLQAFIEAYRGIPGFSEEASVADLRLVYIDGTLAYALSRVARTDSLLTNFHQGATPLAVPLTAIPSDTQALANKIAEQLSLFPKSIFSLDFMHDKNGKPLLIEMNTKPGFDLLFLLGDEQLKNSYFHRFLSLFPNTL